MLVLTFQSDPLSVRTFNRISGAMPFDGECYHSSITFRPDDLKPKLVACLTNTKPSSRMGAPTLYVLTCSLPQTNSEWIVERRYAEFRAMYKVLQAFFLRSGGGARPQCFGCVWFKQTLRCFRFPKRTLLCSRSADVIDHRRAALSDFVVILTSHTFSEVPKCLSCANIIFPQVRDFFLRDAILSPNLKLKTLERTLHAKNFSPVADPSKSKLEFRQKRMVRKVLQMEKPVFSKLSEFNMHNQQIRKKRHQRDKQPPCVDARCRGVLEAPTSA